MVDDQSLVPAQEALVDCLDPGIAAALAQLPVGWWWCGGVCSVSCHASIGPDRAYISEPMLTTFDSGFHADIGQPSTLSEALLDCIEQATAAITQLNLSSGNEA